jgi:hypothetical protein
MEALKAIALVIVVLALLSGCVYWMAMSHEEEKDAARREDYDAWIRTPEGYAKEKVKLGLGMQAHENGDVYLKGFIHNDGDRDLANVAVNLKYHTKEAAGAPTRVDCGYCPAHDKTQVDVYLFRYQGSAAQQKYRAYEGAFSYDVGLAGVEFAAP